MDKTYDVVIVGMGPAGAAAAAVLSRGGLTVLGIDRERHPRYKVCGGGLSARIERVLDPGFRSVIEQTVTGVQFVYCGQEPLLLESSQPIAYMVMRDRFDHWLLQEAVKSGADIETGEGVTGLRQDVDGVEILTARGRCRGRIVIGADGANSVVARNLFPDRAVHRVPAVESEVPIGADPHFPGPATILVDVGAARQGYGWIFPKQGRLSVGVGEFRRKSTGLHQTFDRFVQTAQGLNGRTVPRPAGHPIPAFSEGEGGGMIQLTNGRALLVGDAGHLVDPLFGEGIYYAVCSGELAARSILAHPQDVGAALQAYQQAVGREILPDFRITARIARVLYAFPRLGFKLLRRYRDVVQYYFEVLQGRISAEQFLVEAKQRVKASVNDLLLEALYLR
ncbi:MAG: hypothetical protein NBKEAIPA_02863 [Nitrospirae bacterium]|nr:MAG: geranylgeranyl reductase family protein [Nitrospira sp. OLB3]MBV6470938.1 hypothetical protein [Nitrospirota bacterium]MCE7966432.1 geranylgeranyl reductase family protein [Nitrospira sp. NTP2]MCK6498370.1 geranylgeranyl reductase family protein [Nitrospira sp.]RIK56838.1 MAG: hypothetical protein DCC63_16075 [Nitrospira sp.]